MLAVFHTLQIDKMMKKVIKNRQLMLGAAVFTCLPIAVSAQILGERVLDTQPLLNPVENVIRRTGRELKNDAKRELENLDSQVSRTLEVIDPLAQLPLTLPVVDLTGNAVFVDSSVEGGWRAVERQWLVMLEPGELALLEQLDIEILVQSQLGELNLTLLRFNVSEELNSREALSLVLPPTLVDRMDRNHIYKPQNDTSRPTLGAETTLSDSPISCELPLRVGMIDTGIKLDHPAFANSTIVEKNFLGEQFENPKGHGTAVAGLLVGSNSNSKPRLSNASLYNASVFYSRSDYAQGATMMHLVNGLEWLLSEKVSVINMSLSGPDNAVLAAVITKVSKRGVAIVAAAGNEGPASPPLYPAGYPQVVSATAVDTDEKIYRWANRGDYIDFAAFGVSVLTARGDGEFGYESGTSMAAPIISSYIACELANNQGEITQAIKNLAEKAIDLGDAGRDPVFGYGFLR